MKEWSGKVTKVSERDWGTKTLYSFQFEGANLWFRTEENHDITEGEWLKVSGATPNKISSVERVQEDDVKKEVTTTNGSSGSSEVPPTSSPDYWRWKQMHDLEREDAFLWRDARRDAVQIISTCLKYDAAQPASKDAILALGTKKSGRMDVLRGMINELTEQFVGDMKERLNGD